MSSNKASLPAILDGKFFEVIVSDENGKVKAKCLSCDPNGKDNIIKGSVQPTSNFTTHLKVRLENGSIIKLIIMCEMHYLCFGINFSEKTSSRK